MSSNQPERVRSRDVHRYKDMPFRGKTASANRQAPWKIMNWSIARITDWSIARRKQISIVPILTYSEPHMIYSRHYFNCERSFVQLTTPAVSYSDRFSRKTVSTAHLAQCPEESVFGVGVCCKTLPVPHTSNSHEVELEGLHVNK